MKRIIWVVVSVTCMIVLLPMFAVFGLTGLREWRAILAESLEDVPKPACSVPEFNGRTSNASPVPRQSEAIICHVDE